MVGARRCVVTALVALAGGAGQVVGAVEGVGGQGGWLPLARSADGQSTWEAQVGSAALAVGGADGGGDVTFAAVVRVDGVQAVLTVSLRECRAGGGRVRVDDGAGFAYRAGGATVGDRAARVLCGLGLTALRLTI